MNPNIQVYGTGNPEFDLVMNGGFPASGVSILIGPPGAGKTVTALQVAFTAASAGRRVVYLTNISETHARLLKHVRTMSFYDEALVTRNFKLVSLNSNLQSQGVDAAVQFILNVARSEQVDLLVIDSYLGLKHLLASQAVPGRETLFNLTTRLSLWEVTTLLVGEYSYDSVRSELEFAVADAIVELSYTLEGRRYRRALAVLKLRGRSFLEELHSFAISGAGVQVYPRPEALAIAPAPVRTDQRLSTGIEGLDAMVGGGLFSGSTTLLAGSSGTGKTLLGLQLLTADPAAPSLLISFKETAAQIERYTSHLTASGPDLAQHQLHVLYISPVELLLDQAAYEIRQAVLAHRVQRVVIDNINEVETSIADQHRVHSFMTAMLNFLRQQQATTLIIRELPPMFGAASVLEQHSLIYAVDNVMFAQYVEIQALLAHAIIVLKARGSEHDYALRRMRIDAGRISIHEPLTGLSRLLTGLPQDRVHGEESNL